jgi:hypothetical protein
LEEDLEFAKGGEVGSITFEFTQDLNIKNSEVIPMCERLGCRAMPTQFPYDLEEPDEREITKGLMRLSQQALSKYVDNEPDIY